MMMRRSFFRRLAGAGLLASAAILFDGASAQAQSPTIKAYKTPTCDCCGRWAESMRAEGFTALEENVEDLWAVKQFAGVPDALISCHTAVVDGYTLEGHVPAPAIRRLLEERPAIGGLAVPGMPSGSPGMGGAPERYDVIAFGEGEGTVFATFEGETLVAE